MKPTWSSGKPVGMCHGLFWFYCICIRICSRQSNENRSNQFLCVDHHKMFYALLKVYSSERRGGLMSWSSSPDERSGLDLWQGTSCCVLGQDTLLSQCLSSPRSIIGYWCTWIVGETWQNCGGVTCGGLAFYPGEEQILLAASCYRNRDKLRQLWANLGSKANHYPIYMYCQDKFYWLITNVTCMFKNIAVCLRSSKSLTLVLKQHSISGVNSITYWSKACYNKVKQIWMKS